MLLCMEMFLQLNEFIKKYLPNRHLLPIMNFLSRKMIMNYKLELIELLLIHSIRCKLKV